MQLDVRKMNLATQFLAAAAVVVCTVMAILGAWVSAHIEAGMIKSSAFSSAVLMESFLAPHVQSVPETGGLTSSQTEVLQRFFSNTSLGSKMVSVKIWGLDGTILFNTDDTFIAESVGPERIARAKAGEVVANFEKRLDDRPELDYPFIEVYAPLYRHGGSQIVAVGEFHEDAADLEREVGDARKATWVVVGGTTAAMISILYLVVLRGSSMIVRQRKALTQAAADAQKLSRQNEELRIASEVTLIQAGEAHEQLLGRIGSDLHDGPIQLLSLLQFKLTRILGKNTPEQTRRWINPENFEGFIKENIAAFIHLTGDTLAELRNISTGLVLPEIASLSLEQTLMMAINRHEDLTGTQVKAELSNLPENVSHAVKTCLYRVVQEALNNATRYAGGREQTVIASSSGSQVLVEISDEGPGINPDPAQIGGRKKLGLVGMMNRVAGLKGTLTLEPRDEKGIRVRVALPLASSSSEPVNQTI
jgi:signal transduction histidine kinase